MKICVCEFLFHQDSLHLLSICLLILSNLSVNFYNLWISESSHSGQFNEMFIFLFYKLYLFGWRYGDIHFLPYLHSETKWLMQSWAIFFFQMFVFFYTPCNLLNEHSILNLCISSPSHLLNFRKDKIYTYKIFKSKNFFLKNSGLW